MSHCCWAGHQKIPVRSSMLRRGRSGRPRHLAWSETRRGTDSVTGMSISAEAEEWDRQTTTQITEEVVESEVDHLGSSEPTEAAAPSSLAPVLGESFCQCVWGDEPNAGFGIGADCLCGEDDDNFAWVWDQRLKSSGAFLSCDDRKVSFHSDYSCGTAAIRGTRELADGQHFWEVKMTSPVYGTDMMVGIGTAEVNLEKFKYNFGSLLGHDEDSWGLSYTGLLQHKGEKVNFSSRFGQGSIIGLHLDTWHGTLTVYKNRRCVVCCRSGKEEKCDCHRRTKSLSDVIRCRCQQAAEQEAVPDVVLHSGQEQHEGDPRLLHAHLPAVPLLYAPPQNPPGPPGRVDRPGAASGPAGSPTPAARLAVLRHRSRGGRRRRPPGEPRPRWPRLPESPRQSRPQTSFLPPDAPRRRRRPRAGRLSE
ncbi:SPRY domain-containing SOCS box protein 3 isoform X1 [Phyllopteryx taeniolatus]|uniref:SPRY domain-containing SOCS box protein 3 isoform X1 n=1 Tax=Phyllopteryx taeniolatus TaxID=161469 RepID=UPI002AD31173|nr:SPRY domain-containing SOCS box protein 3 isoform X1 [Phyllopteryx taeniolatus]